MSPEVWDWIKEQGPTVALCVVALWWMAKQWVKSIADNVELARRFAGAQEATNLRLERIERALE
jgi:hypothetical protein